MMGLVRQMLISVVKVYQKSFSLILSGSCRYYPSCSQFAELAIRFDNIPHALIQITFRVFLCNQYSKGGVHYPSMSVDEREMRKHKKVDCIRKCVRAGKLYLLVEDISTKAEGKLIRPRRLYIIPPI